MKILAQARFVKKHVRQLLFTSVVAAALLVLFVRAQPVDPDRHNALISDLRELQMRDTELGEVVLQHHYQLYHNYDRVAAIMRRMQALAAGLTQHQERDAFPDTPEFNRALSLLQQQMRAKENALEEFKSRNAVMKNSFLYLPRQVNAVLAGLPETEHDPFELLVRDLLLITLDQGQSARESLAQDIERVEQAIPRLRGSVQASARSVSLHARSIVKIGEELAGLIAQLSPSGGEGMGESLERLYMRHYQAQQNTATTYRLLLLLAAMLMLGYAIYAYYRMRQKGQELRIAAAAFETQEGILITDLQHRIVQVNQAFTQMTGYSREEALGKTPDLLKSGRHETSFYPRMWETIARENYWQGEVWSRRKNGEIYPVWLTTTAVRDTERKVTHYVSVFADITLRKEAEDQIHKLAFFDPLTNLPNRRLLIDRLSHSMDTGTRSGNHGAILFIDLDNFKTLNDTRGHDVGDLLLTETARRLQLSVRGGDTVARLGGDEFIVLIEGLDAEPGQAAAKARAAGENIREALTRTYWLNDSEYHSSCSIGISLFRGHDISVDDLLKRADTAMYEAKASGRDTLRFFDPSMQAALEARAAIEVDLRNAIKLRQLSLYYQIQMDTRDVPVGAEALLRWTHPGRGLVYPTEFIGIAEDTGLILPVGAWVLEAACAQIKSWEADPQLRKLQLAVNVSARQFHQQDFVGQVRTCLAKTGANPALLKIELTESAVLDDINDTAEKMRELKEIGVRFSMDDFGTGYSSLAYLTQLPLDQLKIDQSFVRNISITRSDAVIVQTIIGMACSLGMEVIAEGVETQAQRDFLEQAGCMVYQGYLFGKPVPLEEFETLARRGSRTRVPAEA